MSDCFLTSYGLYPTVFLKAVVVNCTEMNQVLYKPSMNDEKLNKNTDLLSEQMNGQISKAALLFSTRKRSPSSTKHTTMTDDCCVLAKEVHFLVISYEQTR